MKNKTIKFIALVVALFSITACESVMDMFGYGATGGFSYREIPTDIDTPNPGDDQAKKATQIYKDYINNNLLISS